MKFKKSLKIFIFACLIVLMITITGCNKLKINANYVYDDTNYSVGNKAFGFNINTINIDWIAGNVYIIQSTNNEIIIREDVDIEIEDIYKMHYLYDNGVLNIKYAGSMRNLNYNYKTKDLYLMLPNIANEININSVSSDIQISMVSINDLEIDNVSGYINIEDATINNLEIDNVSGDIIIFDNYIKDLDIDTVSGNAGLSFNSLPLDLDVSSTSATISIYIKDSDPLKISFETISGKLKTNLEYVKKGDTYIFNNGTLEYEIDSVSGSLKVLKK